MRTRWRTLGMIILLAILGPALAGCLQTTANLTIDGDHDTVSGTLRFEADEGILETVVNLDANPSDAVFPDAHTPTAVFQASLGQIPWLSGNQTVKTKPVNGKTIYYTEIKYNAVPFGQFSREDGPSFERVGDQIKFRLPLDAAVYSRGIRADQAAYAFTLAGFTISIKMPGKIVSGNGKVSGTTVTWKIPPCTTETACKQRLKVLTAASFYAVAPSVSPSPSPTASPSASVSASPGESTSPSPKPDGGGLNITWLIIGAVVLAAIILTVVLLLLWLGRRKGEAGPGAIGDPSIKPEDDHM
jgi:hypothetical protein